MNFIFTDEQLELRAAVRASLAGKPAEADVRRLMATPSGYDPTVWTRLSDQLGLPGMAVPEEYEGSGFGYIELGIVFEEMGRALLCAPYLASVALAAEALLRCADEAARKDLLPGLAAGRTIGTLALLERPGRWDEAGVHMRARRQGAEWLLAGHKRHVLDGHVAGLVLVAARTDADVGLFAVDGSAPGLTRTPVPTVDQTRRKAHLEFAATPARLIGAEGAGWPVLRRVLDTAAILMAAEQAGGASRALEMAVDYAKVRAQFGRPIGSFQAIKHAHRDRGGQVGGPTTGCGRSPRATLIFRWPPASPRSTARRPTPGSLGTTSRCMAASASPGSIPPISTSSGRRPARPCSAPRPTTGSCSRRRSEA